MATPPPPPGGAGAIPSGKRDNIGRLIPAGSIASAIDWAQNHSFPARGMLRVPFWDARVQVLTAKTLSCRQNLRELENARVIQSNLRAGRGEFARGSGALDGYKLPKVLRSIS